jgi:hypothetical protein
MTGTDAALTRLSFGPSHLGLLCAGFADGSVRLYDVRSSDSRVMTFDGQVPIRRPLHLQPQHWRCSRLECFLKGEYFLF